MQNFLIKRCAFRHVPPDGGLVVWDNCRPNVASDIISAVAVNWVGIDVLIKNLVILSRTVLEIHELLTL